jgi:hypothetical protein
MPTNALQRQRQAQFKRQLFVTALVVSAATIAWFTTGCGDTAATSPMRANTVRASLLASGNDSLFVCAADTVVASDTAIIGPLGGALAFGPHTLVIPPGALLTPTTITATAPADGHVSAVLQPSGLQFLVPATLTLGYGQCSPPPASTPSIVYLSGPLGQILQWLPSVLHLDTPSVSALIGHFSVYAVAERR